MKTLKSPSSLNNTRPKSIPTPVLLALGYFLLLGIVSVILGQDASWDLRNYHYYNPYMLLTGRIKYDILPAQIQTFFNPLMDVPFFVAIHYLKIPSVIVGFIVGGVHGLNVWAVHYITYFSLTNVSIKYKHLISTATAITSLFGAAYLSVLGTTIGDSTSSLFVLFSLLILIFSLSKQELSIKRIIIAGFIIGLGVGLKLTVAVYGIALIAALNFIPNSIKEKIRNSITLMVAMFTGFLGTAGYWMVLMWINFSNPLFPFFNKVFKSPYIPIDSNLKDLRFLPRDLWQKLFYPFYFFQEPGLVAELPFRDARLAIAYILIVLLIGISLYKLFCKTKNKQNSSLIHPDIFSLVIPFYAAAYVIWLTQFGIYRYLVTLELLTPVLIVLIIGYLYPFKKQVLWICMSIFIFLIATVQPIDWWRSAWSFNYFGINQDTLAQYDNKVILMRADEPMSYLVPHFPVNTRFIRISGNFGLNPETLMRKNVEKIVNKTPENSLYLLDLDYPEKEVEKKAGQVNDLSALSLTLEENNCQSLISSLDNYKICPIKKNVKP